MEIKRNKVLFITHEQKFNLLSIATAKKISALIHGELSLFYVANTPIHDQISQISSIQESMSEGIGSVFYVHENTFETQMIQALQEQQYPFILSEQYSITKTNLSKFLQEQEKHTTYQQILLPGDHILFANERICTEVFA
ncbi:hypothetical protein ACFVS2_22190 [Brevibacillus sp. NPDC058079]|uniref:hypothetical protein n=1 Tax=Brevibacillus sp. NPDC058079 TaxID=3346330 RepID=UPI0036ED2827